MSGARTGPMERFREVYLARYRGHLAECEKRLLELAGEPGGILGESCALTLSAGGKRMRPLLVFLSVKRGTELRDEHYHAAVAVELVHMATLVHDDVLDGAELRRGKPTVAFRYGNKASAAAGDYLFSRAFDILAATGSHEAVSVLAETSLGLSMGELLQRRQTRDFSLRREEYEKRCLLKTAGLFSTSCRLGALLSGCGSATQKAIEEYGRSLGLAFQIADDILDFSGETAELGKRAGADLRDGTVTLPLIIALKRDRGLIDLLEKPPEGVAVNEICDRVRKSGALEAAGRAAAGYVDRATEALRDVADDLDAAPLSLIARMAAERKV